MAKSNIGMMVVVTAGFVIGCGLSEGAFQLLQSSPSPKVATAPKPAPAPTLTPEQSKQKAFESSRSLYGYLLTQQIKKSAFDEDSLKIKTPKYYNNGVCVEANGKNRFGAYVGWKEYCYLVENGTWKLVEPT
jgi:hypothetical protein